MMVLLLFLTCWTDDGMMFLLLFLTCWMDDGIMFLTCRTDDV